MTKDSFISMLEMVMNTSVEMITRVYAVATKMKYRKLVERVLDILDGDPGRRMVNVIEEG